MLNKLNIYFNFMSIFKSKTKRNSGSICESDNSNGLNQPWILLENEDSDGLIISDAKMENLGNIYNKNVFQINSNWLKSEDNEIDKGFISIDKEESVQNVNEATSEIKKINKTTDLLHAKDLFTKERNKTNRFTSGRTWFRAMSNYYKSKFEPLFKEWELFEPIENRISMDDLVTNFIYKEFDLGDAFVSSPNFVHFIDCMITILHSHNHRRNVDYIK